MLHCDLRLRWKVASDLRFRAAISEPQTPSFCGISGDLAPSTRKSLAIAIVRFWCAKTTTHTLVRGTMFVCNGAVTPGPSRECNITFFVKGQPQSAFNRMTGTVAERRVQSVTVPSSRVSRECRPPGLRSLPLKKGGSFFTYSWSFFPYS